MRIIAALDILNGKCVRLTRGDFSSQKIYNEDPVDAAREIEDNGLKYLHVVDLDGARRKMITNYRILEKIATRTDLKIDFGGGVRSDHDLKIAFASGALQVTAGSIAVTSPETVFRWIEKHGREKIILGADSVNRKISLNGWEEESEEDVTEFITRYQSAGIEYVICTDIEKDGMLAGPATELYREISGKVKISLIASGGIASAGDIEEVRAAGCEGVIIGKAIYEGKIKLKELRDLC
mgnify:FL=1